VVDGAAGDFDVLANCDLTGKLSMDARLHDAPPPRVGGRGRPRKRGDVRRSPVRLPAGTHRRLEGVAAGRPIMLARFQDPCRRQEPRPALRRRILNLKEQSMTRTLASPVLVLLAAAQAQAACCYFSAKEKDVNQPAQKAFITWDPVEKIETFTVQPKFEGNALDFGMVIPTPSRPKLDEMPKDFFKALAVYTILKNRVNPFQQFLRLAGSVRRENEGAVRPTNQPPRTVVVLEQGVVGSLDYKIIKAEDANDLFDWLKENKYNYSGDAETLNFYVKKKWLFTTMKIDTMQMKKNADGSFAGEVTPTRFRFASDKLVYPLKITAISVKDTTEALFYVQAPYKVDLPGDMTYQYQWLPLISQAQGCSGYEFGGKKEFLTALGNQAQTVMQRGQQLGFGFQAGQRPMPGNDGRIATTLEWAKKLTPDDIQVLVGTKPYTEAVPNFETLAGLDKVDRNDAKAVEAAQKKRQSLYEQAEKSHPHGYLVREAPAADIANLKILVGHLQQGQVLTKFRKVFTKGEMTDDLEIVPAKVGDVTDKSEYEEILPTSPP